MIGGLGSIVGSAVAAVVVGLSQQYANYYASSGSATSSVVLLLALVAARSRPRGLAGKRRRRLSRRALADFAGRSRSSARSRSCRRSRWTSPKLFDGALDSPGTLQLLALCLLFGGLALTYDLLFGFTGLLSFGHALYFAIGVYMANIAITEWHWSFARGARSSPRVRRPRRCRSCSAPSACASAASRSRW